jgi:hypothetical protein
VTGKYHRAMSATRNVLACFGFVLFSVSFVCADLAGAALGDCGQPIGSGSNPTATDALATLGAAVGLRECETCVCDVDGSDTITATDALRVLSVAIGIPQALLCPPCTSELVALPGRDQSVLLGDTVILIAAASGVEQAASFSWSLVEAPSGSAVTVSDASAATQRIVPDLTGVYRLQLIATEDDRTSDAAEVILNVTATPLDPPEFVGVTAVDFTLERDGRVNPDSQIVVLLTGSVDPTSIETSTVVLTAGGDEIAVALDYDVARNAVTVTPNQPLPIDTAFELEVTDLQAASTPFEFERYSTIFFTPEQESGVLEGVVLAPDRSPLPLVTVSMAGTTTVTDTQGFFRIDDTAPGRQLLDLDPSTVQDDVVYTPLHFLVEIEAGTTPQTLDAPIILTAIDMESQIEYPAEGVLTTPGITDLVVDFSGSNLTFGNGSAYTGPLTLSPVPMTDVPMPFPGASQMFWTIQPGGLHVDPPAPITVPLPIPMDPGAEVDLWAFDHVTNVWENYGLGTVNVGGTTATSNEGQGLPFTGWGALVTRNEVVRPIGAEEPASVAASTGAIQGAQTTPTPISGTVVDASTNALHGVHIEGGGDFAYTDYTGGTFNGTVDGRYVLDNVLVGHNVIVNGEFDRFEPLQIEICATAFDLAFERFRGCVMVDPTQSESYNPSVPDGNIGAILRPDRIVLDEYETVDFDDRIHLHRDVRRDSKSHRLGPSFDQTAIGNSQRYRDEVRAVSAKLASFGYREENSGKPFLMETSEFEEDRPRRAKARCPITRDWPGALHRAVKLFTNTRIRRGNGLVFWGHDGIVDEDVLRAMNETDGVLWAPANATAVQSVHGYPNSNNLTRFIHPTVTERLVSIRDMTGLTTRLNSLTLPMGGDRALRCNKYRKGHDAFHGVGSATDFSWIRIDGSPGRGNFFRTLRDRDCVTGDGQDLVAGCVIETAVNFLKGRVPDPAQEWRDTDPFANETEALDAGRTWRVRADYSRELTTEFVEAIKAQPNRRVVIFNDPRIQAARATGHSHHVHAEFYYEVGDFHPAGTDGVPPFPLTAPTTTAFQVVTVEAEDPERRLDTLVEEITLTFSDAVDPSTLDAGSVMLVSYDTAEVVPTGIRVDASGFEVTVVPATELNENDSFAVAVGTRIRSQTGEPIVLEDESPVVYEFDTGISGSIVVARFENAPIVLTRADLSPTQLALTGETAEGAEILLGEAAEEFILTDPSGRDLDEPVSSDEERLLRTFSGSSLLTAILSNGVEATTVIQADIIESPLVPVASAGEAVRIEFHESLETEALQVLDVTVIDRDSVEYRGTFATQDEGQIVLFSADDSLPRFENLLVRVAIRVEDPTGNTLEVIVQEDLLVIGVLADDVDSDGDGIPDVVEEDALGGCTDPQNPDTDGDGIPDGEEDCDGDSLTNADELAAGTDPGRSDTDGDGILDPIELNLSCDPLRPEISTVIGRVVDDALAPRQDAEARSAGRTALSDASGAFVITEVPACPTRELQVAAAFVNGPQLLEGVSDSFMTVDGGMVDVGDIVLSETTLPRFVSARFVAPSATTTPEDMALGDMNSDGLIDAVVAASSTDTVTVFLGDGAGELFFSGAFGMGEDTTAVALDDLDGDGVLDVIAGDESGSAVVTRLGLGDGTLDAQQSFAVTERVSDVATGDVDGDLIVDVVATHRSGVSLLRGNGDGTLAAEELLPVPDRDQTRVALAKMDAGAVLDLVVVNDDGPATAISILLGNGDGTFQAETVFPAGGFGDALRVVDVDGDTALDVVTSLTSNSVAVLLGTGTGSLGAAQTFPAGDDSSGLAVADLDGNGTLDIVTSNALIDINVLLGNGDGTFEPRTRFGGGSGPTAIEITDLGGDAFADVITANSQSDDVSILLGNGDGTLQPDGQRRIFTSAATLLAERMDGDAFPDLLLGGINFGPSVGVAAGNGDFTFGAIQSFSASGNTRAMAVGDVDDDGTKDVVSANFNGVTLLTGGGDGTLAASILIEDRDGGNANDIAVARVDSDEVVDVVFTDSSNSDVTVLISLGNGSFETARRFSLGAAPSSVAVGDANLDGIADVFVGATSGNNSGTILLTGTGGGDLALPIRIADGQVQGIAVADLNFDTIPDLVSVDADETVFVHIGNGDGSFQQAVPYDTDFCPATPHLLDIEGDGATDILLTHLCDATVSIFYNRGDGTFADAERVAVGPGPHGMALSDLNGDGKTDILTLNSSADLAVIPQR